MLRLQMKATKMAITVLQITLCIKPGEYAVFLYTEEQTQLESLIKGGLQRALETLGGGVK